jgi:hypothetical protein
MHRNYRIDFIYRPMLMTFVADDDDKILSYMHQTNI